MESISSIKADMSRLKETELPEFISKYKDDSRAGVIAIVKRAEKKYIAYENELKRTYELQAFERKYSDYQYICGIDEVGRGPLAGPVVAGAVILPKDCDILYINDSKKTNSR